MKKLIKKLIPVSILLIMAIAMLVPSVNAYNGNLTFIHGVKSSQCITYAKTVSTATETSIGFTGTARITAGEKAAGTYGITYVYKANTSSNELDFYAGASKGSSYFYYYVDGVCLHHSDAWWNFDFR